MPHPQHLTLPLSACLSALLCLAPHQSRAQPAPQLKALVQGFYTPYLGDSTKLDPPADDDVIAAHATPALRRLIRNDQACENRGGGVCNLDFDVIINGQDWDLKQPPSVAVKQSTASQITIASHFTSAGTPIEVDYIFVKSGAAWLISDMAAPAPAPGWRLTDILAHEPN